MIAVLRAPLDVVPDLTTRGALERYGRLRAVGFSITQATAAADAGYDVIGYVPIEGDA